MQFGFARIRPPRACAMLACPHCARTILIVRPNRHHTPNLDHFGLEEFDITIDDPRPWLTDSDTIAGFAKRISKVPMLAPCSEASTWFGRCWHCGSGYYVIKAALIHAAPTPALTALLHENIAAPECNWLIQAQSRGRGWPAPWILHEIPTPSAPLHRHVLGPYPFPASGSRLPAFKHGGDLLARLWPGLNAMARPKAWAALVAHHDPDREPARVTAFEPATTSARAAS